jgi:hypothetical protein
MANTIQIKRSSTAGSAPTAEQLAQGELAVNLVDKRMFTKNASNEVVELTHCRAWVNFNGTGTVAIRASHNVSSIVDNGTGDYTVNFTTAIQDANYAAPSTCNVGASTGTMRTAQTFDYATGSVKVQTFRGVVGTIELSDMNIVEVAVVR